MTYRPKVIPVDLFPGDWCLLCIDPAHPNAACHMLEYKEKDDGTVAVEPCGCDNSITAGVPGRYLVRVNIPQKE